MNMIGILRTFLVFLWCLLVLPLHAIHEIIEEHHAEVHHCEESTCISKFNPECDLCLYQQAAGIKTDAEEISAIPLFPSKRVVFSSVHISRIALKFPKNKAPPIF